MNAQTRKLAGFAIAAVGAVIAFIGVFAREIGLGEGGFGPRQIIATVVGFVLLGAGLLIALVLDIGGQGQRGKTSPVGGDTQPPQPESRPSDEPSGVEFAAGGENAGAVAADAPAEERPD